MKTNKNELPFLQRTGQYLIIASILGFVAAIVLSCIPASVNFSNGIASDGTIAAVSVIFLLMGSAFAMPGLLRENSNPDSYSTMRFIVLAVILVFAAITIKIGWQTSSFEDFKINTTWVYILGLAFGAKVAQTFTEDSSTEKDNDKDEDADDDKKEKPSK
jgi:DMSO reductase anchor subunit